MQMRKEQIEQLFRQHYPRMYQLALVLLKDEAASKDVVSDVFADVLDGDVELLPDKARSYLLVCVRNKCLTLINRQKMKDRVHHLLQLDASPTIEPAEATIAAIDRETDKQETILAYMESELTPQTNQVLQLRFRQKLKYREIATELGISEVAVYKHLAQDSCLRRWLHLGFWHRFRCHPHLYPQEPGAYADSGECGAGGNGRFCEE